MADNKESSSKLFTSIKEALQTEKVSASIDAADAARIDLLIDRGLYADRSDFISKAITDLLAKQEPVIDEALSEERKEHSAFFIGITKLDKNDFLEYKYRGERISIKGYGQLILESGIDDLIFETVESIHVVGSVSCSERVRKAYLPTR